MTTSRVTTSVRLLAGAAALLVLGGCAGDDSPTASSPEPTPETQEPTAAEPELHSYGPAKVRTTADADALAGAPASFKEFIGQTAEQVVAGAACDDGFVGVRVRAVRTDGFADGSVNGCDPYLALWAVVDGDWTEIESTLDLLSCAVLEKHQVPSDIGGDTCYDRDAQAQRDYHQA